MFKNGQVSEYRMKEENQFAAEMDHFSGCLLDGKDSRTPGEEGLAEVRAIAAIAEAWKRGKTVAVGKG